MHICQLPQIGLRYPVSTLSIVETGVQRVTLHFLEHIFIYIHPDWLILSVPVKAEVSSSFYSPNLIQCPPAAKIIYWPLSKSEAVLAQS